MAGANYFEREVFDLFGVRFTGILSAAHPDARGLGRPPLRKDYPVEGYAEVQVNMAHLTPLRARTGRIAP